MQKWMWQSKVPTTACAYFIYASVVCSLAYGQGKHEYVLRGEKLIAGFEVENGELKIAGVEDHSTRAKLEPREAFSLLLHDGRVITASQMKIAGTPAEKAAVFEASASRKAERIVGRELCADLNAENSALSVHWCAIVRKGTNYLRQEVTLTATRQPVDIAEVRMFDFNASNAQVIGKVAGSPITAGTFFFGFESPLSTSVVIDGHAIAVLKRTLPLEAGKSITYSSVIGVVARGQMRRDFLSYLENERAHPYRTFLHYNSWYDLGAGERYDEADALERVRFFGNELASKRGVKMDSFLFDDGWDNTQSLWGFNPGLPDGFTKIHSAAKHYGFGIGVWMSPWGGYDEAKKQRIVTGEKAGYETVKGGFALSAPKYYGLFENTCLEMVTKYGVNQFKLDGTGNASTVFPGSLFDSDFSAAIHLIERLRQQDPSIFINLTTGTKPSPFWLRYADSISRGGEDHSFDGVGSWRQKWITYRDEQIYRNIVQGGPLFPISSLMLHGIIFAKEGKNLADDPKDDFTDEVHDYFGEGTQLQEMYITPSLLTKKDWDALAESALWSRRNAEILKDTHWIGGDPGKLEVYGFASWTLSKGIIVLRNPADHAQEFLLDVGKVFELPAKAAKSYRAHSPWRESRTDATIQLNAGSKRKIELKPFEVVTFDAFPLNRR